MATFDTSLLETLSDALKLLDNTFSSLPTLPQTAKPAQSEMISNVLLATAERLQDNYPYQHPLYMGQMLKPPHPLAQAAYMLAMFINPNNHALDGGRASSAMEKEAVAEMAQLFGFANHLGHLTSGGTVANLEALWVARELSPGKGVAASSQAHYTHERLCGVLGVPFQAVAVDSSGRMDVEALRATLSGGQIGTVVATLGTTALGAVDPLPQILAVCRENKVRVHVDAAYGGYFRLLDYQSGLDEATVQTLAAIDQADSLVVDPHKHGLQPYGCGCVMFSDPAVGHVYHHNSPYTYFTSDDLHLGEISLECSRPGAAAVALWATLQALPLTNGGEFAQGLAASRQAALALFSALSTDQRFNAVCVPLLSPELDIVVWAIRAQVSSRSSAAAERLFALAAHEDLHLAVVRVPRAIAEGAAPVSQWDSDTLTCLRACTMKPGHHVWMPQILARLGRAIGKLPG